MLNDLDFLHYAFPKSPFYLADPLIMLKERNLETIMRRSCTAATLVVIDAAARRFYALGPASLPPQPGLISEQSSENKQNLTLQKPSVMLKNDVLGNRENRIKANNEEDKDDSEEFDVDKFHAQQAEKHADVHHTDHTAGISRADILVGKKFKYRIMTEIGRGAYAKVYNCARQDGRKFAIKVFDPVDLEDDDVETAKYSKLTVLREIEFLKKLSRQTIIEVEEMIGTGEGTMLILEKMDMTLLDLRVDRSRGKPAQVEVLGCYILSQVCDAVAYLHSMNIVHRDIKPENILISKYGQVVKLADFGSAIEVLNTSDSLALDLLGGKGKVTFTSSDEGPGTLTNYVGSRWYRAPEVLANGINYSYASDIWAVGCTFAEFVCGAPMFVGETEQDVLDSIVCYYASVPASIQSTLTSRGLKINRPSIRNTFHTKLALLSVETRSIMQRIFVLDADEREHAQDLLQEILELLSQYIPDEAFKKNFFENYIKPLQR